MLTTHAQQNHPNINFLSPKSYCSPQLSSKLTIRHKEQVRNYTKVITSHFLSVASPPTTISLFPGRAAVRHDDRGVDI